MKKIRRSAGAPPSEEMTVPSEQGSMDIQLDRGLVAWTQVLVSHLLVINGFGYLSSFGLFQTQWEETLGRSSADIAWVGSVQLFLLFFIGTLSGRAMDAGYFRSLVWCGCSMQLIGVFTTSAVEQYWQLLLSHGVLQGLGNGLLFTPLVALVSLYFVKRRAFALSIAACGAPVGGVVFSVIARQLTPMIGFAWTIRVMGSVILFNTLLIILLARPRNLRKSPGPLIEWQAFREPAYSLFAVGIFFVLWGVYIAYFYTTTYGRDIVHESSSDSLTLLIVLNAAGVPGRIIPALLADLFFGPFNTLIPFSLGAGILLLSWMSIHSFDGFEAFVIVYGICANAVQTLFPSSLASLTSDISKMGLRTGMVFTVGSIACLTGNPIAGLLVSAENGRYEYMQIFGGTTVILGSIVLLVARIIMYSTRERI